MLNRRRVSGGGERFYSFSNYIDLIKAEKERSQRHKHFFVIIGLILFGKSERHIFELLKTRLRVSDCIFLLENENKNKENEPLKIAILLPETDYAGGYIVKERLIELFSIHEINLQMGMSVYPDDATISEDLMELAFKSALPVDTAQCVD